MNEFGREEDAPARSGPALAGFGQAHHLAGGDHEGFPCVQRPMPVAEAEAASAPFEVSEHEKVVRVSVIAGRVRGRGLV